MFKKQNKGQLGLGIRWGRLGISLGKGDDTFYTSALFEQGNPLFFKKLLETQLFQAQLLS